MGPFPSSDTTSKSIRRAVSRALLILLTLYLATFQKVQGQATGSVCHWGTPLGEIFLHFVILPVDAGSQYRDKLSPGSRTAGRWNDQSAQVADGHEAAQPPLEALPSELNVVPPPISVDRIQASADEQACPVSPENRQEGRARLTRHKKYLDGLKARMFVIIQLS